MVINKANIANALHSIAPDHVVVVADDIYDEGAGKYQKEINANVAQAQESITRIDDNLVVVNDRVGDREEGRHGGMGYVLLDPTKTFAEQVTKANTIYEIRYDFNLGGAEVTIPSGCVLKFEGGKLKNGNINGEFVVENQSDKEIFVVIDDNNKIMLNNCLAYINSAWFGLDKTGSSDCSYKLLAIVRALSKSNAKLQFALGTYLHGDGATTALEYPYITREDGSKIPDRANGAHEGIGRNIIMFFDGYTNLTIDGGGATILSHPNNGEVYHNSILYFKSCNGLTLRNISIDGNKNARQPQLSDYSYGNIAVRNNISVHAADNMLFENVISNNSIMDGLYLEDSVTNSRIVNCIFNNNYRQGITVGNKCKNLVIENTECSNTGQDYGTLPMAGIDIEANADATVEGIPDSTGTIVRGCTFTNNKGSGVDMAIGARDNVIDSCVVINCGGLGGNTSSAKSYNNTIKNCFVRDTAIYLNVPGFNFENNVCYFSVNYNKSKDYILTAHLENFSYDEVVDGVVLHPLVIKSNVFRVEATDSNDYGKVSIIGKNTHKSDCCVTDNIFTNGNASNSVPLINIQHMKAVYVLNNSFVADKGHYGTASVSADLFVEKNNYCKNYLSQSIKLVFPSSIEAELPAEASMPPNGAVGAWGIDKTNCMLKIWDGSTYVDATGAKIYAKFGNKPSLRAGKDVGSYVCAADHEYRALFWSGYSWRRADGYPVTTLDTGNTSQRPPASTAQLRPGFCYFDTDKGKPIWWNGSKWVDSTGTEV